MATLSLSDRRAFEAEVVAATSVRHDHIAQVQDIGTVKRRFFRMAYGYIVMPFMPGGSLERTTTAL